MEKLKKLTWNAASGGPSSDAPTTNKVAFTSNINIIANNIYVEPLLPCKRLVAVPIASISRLVCDIFCFVSGGRCGGWSCCGAPPR